MGMVEQQAGFLRDFALLIQEATRQGFVVTAGELLRTKEQQEIYVHTGRSKTMNSRHLDKLAGDLNFFLNDVWVNGLPAAQARDILAPLGHFWEGLNALNTWGGNFDHDWSKEDAFKDVPHFERRPA